MTVGSTFVFYLRFMSTYTFFMLYWSAEVRMNNEWWWVAWVGEILEPLLEEWRATGTRFVRTSLEKNNDTLHKHPICTMGKECTRRWPYILSSIEGVLSPYTTNGPRCFSKGCIWSRQTCVINMQLSVVFYRHDKKQSNTNSLIRTWEGCGFQSGGQAMPIPWPNKPQ